MPSRHPLAEQDVASGLEQHGERGAVGPGPLVEAGELRLVARADVVASVLAHLFNARGERGRVRRARANEVCVSFFCLRSRFTLALRCFALPESETHNPARRRVDGKTKVGAVDLLLGHNYAAVAAKGLELSLREEEIVSRHRSLLWPFAACALLLELRGALGSVKDVRCPWKLAKVF